jgi:probable FeS assembly SUF system protein SufT
METQQTLRDCPAVQIPSGETGIIPKGTPFFITQSLGNSHTVRTDYGLYRVNDVEADALGLTPRTIAPASPSARTGTGAGTGTGPAPEITVEEVQSVLRHCYDPEIPVNIVDLGLVYDIKVSQLPSGQSRVDVQMTLTAPGCGMGPSIAGDAQQRLLMLDGVEDAFVEIVWDPPWHQSRITEEGRRLLGLE